jgi:serine/threonine-protein kinase
MIGRVVGPYRVVERLGEGGMGVVYRAVDERLERSVALKFLAAGLTRDPEARRRFLLEARAASRIEHANVCTVYEAGETPEGEAYLAMAFYEGETLERRLARGPLPVEEALDVATQLARGLARAHEAGIVHRDVKPGNVMITAHGEAKLLDFGLARLRDAAPITREGTMLGTPVYMAPEQIRGEAVGPPADVWALGAVLYEMLTGRPPFGRDARSAPGLILGAGPTPIAEARPETPPAVVAAVARALAREPADRYPNATALLGDLEAARRVDSGSRMATVAVTAVPDPAAPGRRRALIAALVVAGALLAGAGWWLLDHRGGPSMAAVEAPAAGAASVIAVFPFVVRGDAEWDYLGEGMVDLLATKLDGAGELRATDPNAVLAAARQGAGSTSGPAAARDVAGRLGAGLFVLGDVVEAGGRLHVSASLYGGEDRPLARATVEGAGEELFALIDELTADLLAERFAGPAARVARTATITSESLPAVKSYLQGESLFRAGRFAEALAAYQAAVEEDPDFALAWYRVSVAGEWATRLELIEPAAARALELADRLPARDRDLLEARVLARGGQVGEAERLYRSLVRAYPDEMEAWMQLGEVLSHYRFQTGRSLTASREAWERVLALEPDNISALWHLARVAAAEGEREELTEIIDRLLPITPESERRLEIRALRMVGTGDMSGEAELVSDLRAGQDITIMLAAWNIVLASDERATAERLLELLVEPSRHAKSRAWGRAALAALELARGRLGASRSRLAELRREGGVLGLELAVPLAVAPFAPAGRDDLLALQAALLAAPVEEKPSAEAAPGFAVTHDPWHPALRLFALGVLEAALGDDAAAARAEALDAMEAQFSTDLARTVRAYRALLAGDAATAAAEAGAIDLRHRSYNYNDASSSPYFSATLPRYLHAQALFALGRFEEALPVLRSFGETNFTDRAYEPAALVLQGEALLALDRPDGAAAAFRRALALWSEAEPALRPWLDRAEGGLAAARREGP